MYRRETEKKEQNDREKCISKDSQKYNDGIHDNISQVYVY